MTTRNVRVELVTNYKNILRFSHVFCSWINIPATAKMLSMPPSLLRSSLSMFSCTVYITQFVTFYILLKFFYTSDLSRPRCIFCIFSHRCLERKFYGPSGCFVVFISFRPKVMRN